MKLLTKAIEKALPRIGVAEDESGFSKAKVKFFDPTGSWTWYASEGQRTKDGDYCFYGVVCGYEREYGYFLLSELEHAKDGIRGLQGLAIERDLHFKPKPLSECV